MSTANYSHCIVTVIAEGFRRFGKPTTPEQFADMTAWVQCQVNDIRAGRPLLEPPPERDSPVNDDTWTRY